MMISLLVTNYELMNYQQLCNEVQNSPQTPFKLELLYSSTYHFVVYANLKGHIFLMGNYSHYIRLLSSVASLSVII